MSIKSVSPIIVGEVLKEQTHERADGSSKEDGAKEAAQKDQFVRLSVNLQRTMGLFDFSAAAAADSMTVASNGGHCGTVYRRDGCDVIRMCDFICPEDSCGEIKCFQVL